MQPTVLSAGTITSDQVVNDAGEHLGKMQDIMIDLDSGRIAYAVMSFGGFMGTGDKLFAVPWEAFQVSFQDKNFILNVPKEKLKQAPGFDKNNWPAVANYTWLPEVYEYYGCTPFWV
jgi:sporulation protein YlmC with PRC-barrel domain